MKNLMSNFSGLAMSRMEMKSVTGGWCYQYDCNCGSTGYNGYGNLQTYQKDAISACSGQGPISCQFNQLPNGYC